MNVRDLFSETPSGLGFSLRREEVSEYFKIDGESRVITPPTDFKNFGVESDENSKRVWFEAPRIVGDEIDLSTLNLYVNYKNANGEVDKYYADDVEVVDDKIYFSWKLERKPVRYKGTLTFIVCAIKTNSKGEIQTEWNTTLCTGTVLEGLEVENPEVPEAESDLINQLIDVTKKSIKDVTDTCAQTIEELGTKEQEAINNIAEKETSSIAAVEKAKNDAVDYIGSGLDATLTKQGIAAESQAVGDAILKARIVDRASGEIISLADSAEAPLQSMKIFGKTKQFTTTGKNLFNNDVSRMVPIEVYSKDGSPWTKMGYEGFSLPAGTYTFTTSDYSGTDKYVYCSITNANGEFLNFEYLLATNNKTVTISITVNDGDKIYVYNGITYNPGTETARRNDLKTVQIQLEAGDKATPYEPYTGGIPSPNPNYPQELVSVGDSGSTTEYVMGGNLFDNDTSLLKEVTYTVSQGNRSTRIGYEPLCLPAGTYTFTLTDLDTSLEKYVYGCINDKDDKFVRACNLLQYTNNYTPLTITVNEGDKIYIYDGRPELDITKCSKTFKTVQIQLEAGDKATPYEPYKEQSLTIPTPNGLPGIPVSSGGNYTDSNGQHYVCDYKDHERNVYVQRTGEYRNTGEPMSMATGIVSSKNEKVIYWNTCLYGIKPHKLHENKTIISNYFVNSYKYDSTEGCCSMISHSATNNGTYLYFSASVDTLEYGTTYTDAKTAISAWLAKTFSEDNPLIVRYQLAEPIETPLTEEEIQAYKALHTNYPNTTIYNSDGAGAEVEYLADTKNYIDNKIAQLVTSSEV